MAQIVLNFPDLYDTEEACQALGIGQATLYRWLQKGKINSIKVKVNSMKGFGSTYFPKIEIARLKKELKTELADNSASGTDGVVSQ